MAFFNIFNAWLHVIFAVMAVGGGLFNILILIPVLKEVDSEVAGKISYKVLLKFVAMIWISLVGLYITGFIRVLLDYSMSYAFSPNTIYGMVMDIKMFFVLVITVIASMITLMSKKLPSLSPDEKMSVKKKISTLALINNLTAIFVIFLAVSLRYGGNF